MSSLFKVVNNLVTCKRPFAQRQLNKRIAAVAIYTAAILVMTGMTMGCEQKKDHIDQVQSTVEQGNNSLLRMEEIDKNLRAEGILIKHPALSNHLLDRKTTSELSSLKALVLEYIQHAETVMRITTRPDVRFSDKISVADSLSGAQRLLAFIEMKNSGQNPPANSSLSPEVWTEWKNCQKWTKENLTTCGIVLRPDLATAEDIKNAGVRPPCKFVGPITDDPKVLESYLARIGRQRRTLIYRALVRQSGCLEIEMQVERAFGRQNEFRMNELSLVKRDTVTLQAKLQPLILN